MIVRGVVPELVLAVALLLSPFVFIHLGASYDLMERVLDWGILGIGLRPAVRLDRVAVIRTGGILRHRGVRRRLPAG